MVLVPGIKDICWQPEYWEFVEAAKKGLVSLSIMSHDYPWLFENVLGSDENWWGSIKNYDERLLVAMFKWENIYDKVRTRDVDLVLHEKPQEHILKFIKRYV